MSSQSFKNWIELHKVHLLSIQRFVIRLVPELDDKQAKLWFIYYLFRNHDYVPLYVTCDKNISTMKYPQGYLKDNSKESFDTTEKIEGEKLVDKTNENESKYDFQYSEVDLENDNEYIEFFVKPITFEEQMDIAEEIVAYAREDGYLQSNTAIVDLAHFIHYLQNECDYIMF